MPGVVPTRSALPGADAAFVSTQWSIVLDSHRDSPHRRAALEQPCRTYWLPVYGYLRRRQHAPADAEDLTQGFFVYLLDGDFLHRPEPANGRFRGYLVGVAHHFLSRHFEHATIALATGGLPPRSPCGT